MNFRPKRYYNNSSDASYLYTRRRGGPTFRPEGRYWNPYPSKYRNCGPYNSHNHNYHNKYSEGRFQNNNRRNLNLNYFPRNKLECNLSADNAVSKPVNTSVPEPNETKPPLVIYDISDSESVASVDTVCLSNLRSYEPDEKVLTEKVSTNALNEEPKSEHKPPSNLLTKENLELLNAKNTKNLKKHDIFSYIEGKKNDQIIQEQNSCKSLHLNDELLNESSVAKSHNENISVKPKKSTDISSVSSKRSSKEDDSKSSDSVYSFEMRIPSLKEYLNDKFKIYDVKNKCKTMQLTVNEKTDESKHKKVKHKVLSLKNGKSDEHKTKKNKEFKTDTSNNSAKGIKKCNNKALKDKEKPNISKKPVYSQIRNHKERKNFETKTDELINGKKNKIHQSGSESSYISENNIAQEPKKKQKDFESNVTDECDVSSNKNKHEFYKKNKTNNTSLDGDDQHSELTDALIKNKKDKIHQSGSESSCISENHTTQELKKKQNDHESNVPGKCEISSNKNKHEFNKKNRVGDTSVDVNDQQSELTDEVINNKKNKIQRSGSVSSCISENNITQEFKKKQNDFESNVSSKREVSSNKNKHELNKKNRTNNTSTDINGQQSKIKNVKNLSKTTVHSQTKRKSSIRKDVNSKKIKLTESDCKKGNIPWDYNIRNVDSMPVKINLDAIDIDKYFPSQQEADMNSLNLLVADAANTNLDEIHTLEDSMRNKLKNVEDIRISIDSAIDVDCNIDEKISNVNFDSIPLNFNKENLDVLDTYSSEKNNEKSHIVKCKSKSSEAFQSNQTNRKDNSNKKLKLIELFDNNMDTCLNETIKNNDVLIEDGNQKNNENRNIVKLKLNEITDVISNVMESNPVKSVFEMNNVIPKVEDESDKCHKIGNCNNNIPENISPETNDVIDHEQKVETFPQMDHALKNNADIIQLNSNTCENGSVSKLQTFQDFICITKNLNNSKKIIDIPKSDVINLDVPKSIINDPTNLTTEIKFTNGILEHLPRLTPVSVDKFPIPEKTTLISVEESVEILRDSFNLVINDCFRRCYLLNTLNWLTEEKETEINMINEFFYMCIERHKVKLQEKLLSYSVINYDHTVFFDLLFQQCSKIHANEGVKFSFVKCFMIELANRLNEKVKTENYSLLMSQILYAEANANSNSSNLGTQIQEVHDPSKDKFSNDSHMKISTINVIESSQQQDRDIIESIQNPISNLNIAKRNVLKSPVLKNLTNNSNCDTFISQNSDLFATRQTHIPSKSSQISPTANLGFQANANSSNNKIIRSNVLIENKNPPLTKQNEPTERQSTSQMSSNIQHTIPVETQTSMNNNQSPYLSNNPTRTENNSIFQIRLPVLFENSNITDLQKKKNQAMEIPVTSTNQLVSNNLPSRSQFSNIFAKPFNTNSHYKENPQSTFAANNYSSDTLNYTNNHPVHNNNISNENTMNAQQKSTKSFYPVSYNPKCNNLHKQQMPHFHGANQNLNMYANTQLHDQNNLYNYGNQRISNPSNASSGNGLTQDCWLTNNYYQDMYNAQLARNRFEVQQNANKIPMELYQYYNHYPNNKIVNSQLMHANLNVPVNNTERHSAVQKYSNTPVNHCNRIGYPQYQTQHQQYFMQNYPNKMIMPQRNATALKSSVEYLRNIITNLNEPVKHGQNSKQVLPPSKPTADGPILKNHLLSTNYFAHKNVPRLNSVVSALSTPVCSNNLTTEQNLQKSINTTAIQNQTFKVSNASDNSTKPDYYFVNKQAQNALNLTIKPKSNPLLNHQVSTSTNNIEKSSHQNVQSLPNSSITITAIPKKVSETPASQDLNATISEHQLQEVINISMSNKQLLNSSIFQLTNEAQKKFTSKTLNKSSNITPEKNVEQTPNDIVNIEVKANNDSNAKQRQNLDKFETDINKTNHENKKKYPAVQTNINVATSAHSHPIMEERSNKNIQQKNCTKCSGPAEYSCSACLNTAYCSLKCQISDWQEHMTSCKKKS